MFPDTWPDEDNIHPSENNVTRANIIHLSEWKQVIFKNFDAFMLIQVTFDTH